MKLYWTPPDETLNTNIVVLWKWILKKNVLLFLYVLYNDMINDFWISFHYTDEFDEP